jgi:hypothetical protein
MILKGQIEELAGKEFVTNQGSPMAAFLLSINA